MRDLDGRPHHDLEEHTADVRVRVVAPTLGELFAEAGRALGVLMTGEADCGVGAADGADGMDEQHVSIRARDRAALLVQWLNELIFLSETRGRIYSSFDIERLTDEALEATVRGAAPRSLKTAVKAATWHGIAVERLGDAWVARIVLDV